MSLYKTVGPEIYTGRNVIIEHFMQQMTDVEVIAWNMK